MTAIHFNTVNQTYRQLLGNGLSYRVPRFQRDYSWSQDEWDDLWQDIQGVLLPTGEPAHYMGYLVLQTSDNKAFDVIDGQQRLTTLSVLVLAVLRVLQDLVEEGVEPENNRRRIEQLRSSYIGYLDPVTLVAQSKLTLNRNNDGFYKDYLLPLQKLPQRGLRASERLLRGAFEWFYRQVGEAYGPAGRGAELARLIDELSDKLFFTVITVTDELNAFKVFETLNARGVRLSPTDLLKNYLFSVVQRESAHAEEIESLERRWETMVGRLGGESFPDFLRTHWNSRKGFVREADLFKTLRAETPDKAGVFQLLRQMEEDLDVYAALSDPEDALWNDAERRHVRELRLFGVRQPWPFLLACRRAFDAGDFADLLRACSIVSLRYNVIGGMASNEQERVYNRVAQQVASKQVATPAETIQGLAWLYPPDNVFRAAFAEKVMRTTASRNRQVARYLLFSLERQLSGQDLDVDSPRYSLEHVLPENPDVHWPHFTDEQAIEAVYRLGNLTLLEADLNRTIGNASFDEKKPVYTQSGFLLTQRLPLDNAEWTIDRIAERQRWMARQATSIWRISQLD
ncbi:MAG TPA: DUF262 domain-containing protein [Pirellulales bacterium]|nr:DUF262 domain-containing protein [Pirellulales bacterium]